MRSNLEFSHLVRDYHDRLGIPFRYHLYVPETHPITNQPFCEREDEAHVLKVLGAQRSSHCHVLTMSCVVIKTLV